jgi:REP element-mobilizing transposase RayT
VSSGEAARSTYRRNLPHIQNAGQTLFITFATWRRWILPEHVRAAVLRHCVHDHGKKATIHGAVVMPDHVHLIFTPLSSNSGEVYRLAEIMSGIKGASAHTVNRMLSRRGHVWQDESFDHVLRSAEEIRAKVEYICANPIRAGIVDHEDDYPWLWREWVEGLGS